MVGGDNDTSILDKLHRSSLKDILESTGGGRLLLTEVWHTGPYAVSVCIMRAFIGQ